MAENTVINALKRLERAGSDESKATRKLIEAARTVSDQVIILLDKDIRDRCDMSYAMAEGRRVVEMPQWIVIDWARTPEGEQPYKVLCILYGHDIDPVDGDRETALAFARLVANGWLDELAAWLEARATEAEQAATTIEQRNQ